MKPRSWKPRTLELPLTAHTQSCLSNTRPSPCEGQGLHVPACPRQYYTCTCILIRIQNSTMHILYIPCIGAHMHAWSHWEPPRSLTHGRVLHGHVQHGHVQHGHVVIKVIVGTADLSWCYANNNNFPECALNKPCGLGGQCLLYPVSWGCWEFNLSVWI